MCDVFKNNGIKKTRQREIIYSLVNEKPLTIKELLSKKTDEVDNSTLYRILDLFVDKGIFLKYINRDGHVYYMVDEGHTHYVNCIECNNRVKIQNCPIEDMKENIYKETGFTLLSHNMILDGICDNCQKSR